MDPNLEILAFEEKMALAELEEAKAHMRVKELKFEKARFTMDVYKVQKKQEQEKSKE